MSGRTYTEDEFRAEVSRAVDASVGGLRTQLADLQASQEAAAVEARIATAVEEAAAPLRTQVGELQASLDAAVLEAANEKARADGLQATLEKATTDAEIAARRDDRLAKVKEAAPGFKEDYLAANADRWAAMDDAEFATRLEEYEAITATADKGAGGLPTTSALQATVSDKAAANKGGPAKSAVSNLAALRRNGVDVRTI